MKKLAQAVLLIEPLLLAITVGVFWFPDTNSRLWSLILFIPPMIARLILYRRLWVYTPLNWLLYLFLAVGAINTSIALTNPAVAPYSWGWWSMGRPLMGVGLALSLASIASERGSVKPIVLVVLLLSVLVGVLGLGSAQYTEKSAQLQALVNLVPKISGFPGAEHGFNVNEIGGAMAFFAPFVAGVAFYDWRSRTGGALIRRIVATIAFILLSGALILGQSRFAIFGVLLALGALSFLLIPARRWRYLALVVLVLVTVFEVYLIVNPAPSDEVLTARDENSLATRLEIWGSALAIIRDHPLSGVGLNMFRANIVRAQYPAPAYGNKVLPHAHDELLQVGSDMGLPGVILYVAWHGVLLVMLLRIWRTSDNFVRAAALAAGAGLAAHAFFGLADAIALYDRFIFAYWLMVGIIAGCYLQATRSPRRVTPNAAD